MHIGIDARMYGSKNGGIGRYVEELVTRVITSDRENEYTIFISSDTELRHCAQNVHIVKTKIHWYTLCEQILFPMMLARYKIDLMHFPHWNVPLMYTKPFVVTIHDLILRHFPSRDASTHGFLLYFLKQIAYRLVLSHALNSAKHILTVSKFTKQDIISMYQIAPERITVLHLGMSEKLINNRTQNSSSTWNKYFLYVGVHYPHKNLQFLCNTFMSFAARHTQPLTLVLAGPQGPCTKNLLSFICRFNMQSNRNAILYIENPSDAALAALYSHAQAFVFPSLYEGFGIPPLEAQALGVPVIASNVSAMPEILKNNALLVPPQDTAAWHEAFRTVLEEENTRQMLIQKGLENCKNYSWDTLASSTHALYNKILEKVV